MSYLLVLTTCGVVFVGMFVIASFFAANIAHVVLGAALLGMCLAIQYVRFRRWQILIVDASVLGLLTCIRSFMHTFGMAENTTTTLYMFVTIVTIAAVAKDKLAQPGHVSTSNKSAP